MITDATLINKVPYFLSIFFKVQADQENNKHSWVGYNDFKNCRFTKYVISYIVKLIVHFRYAGWVKIQNLHHSTIQ